MNSVLKEIDKDCVNFAYNALKDLKETKKLPASNFYNALVSLHNLVSKALRSKKQCNSCPEDIFNLAELCCKSEAMWKTYQRSSMTCIYYIVRYLIQEEKSILARKLCQYIFLFCSKTRLNSDWPENESSTISKTITYFSLHISSCKDKLSDPESDMNPLISWFKFILKFNKFHDFMSSSEVWQLAYSVLRRSLILSDHAVFNNILEEFVIHLGELLETKRNWSPNQQVSLSFFDILTLIVINSEKLNFCFISILKFINVFKNIVFTYSIHHVSVSDIEFVKSAFTLLSLKKSNVTLSSFEKFYNYINSDKKYSLETHRYIFSIVSILRSEIFAFISTDKCKLVNLVKKLLEMFTNSKHKDTSQNSLLHGFTAPMYFLCSADLDSETWKKLFTTVGSFYSELFSLIKTSPRSQDIFNYGVVYCINVLTNFKTANLFKEMASLSKILMKNFLLLNQNYFPAENFKVMEHFLSHLVTSYCKVGLSVEAQFALLALVSVQPQMASIILKYWAELKVNATDFNFQKDSTCRDLIISHREEIEKLGPSCSVDSINIEKCLLEEIRAYAKHKELQVESVVAVFRVSVESIKDKLILAQILTAAVDCVSTDENVSKLKNFQLSLENIHGSLSRLKDLTHDAESLGPIYCYIGDILYQQARCEIAQIRKKAEDEMELLKVPSKEDVPVIEGVDNNVTPAYSYLKLPDQLKLVEKMFMALDNWSKASKLVTLQNSEQCFCFRYFKGLALLFRLYGYRGQEVELWKLMYTLSKTYSNSKYKTLAVAELLGLSDYVDDTWVKDVEETLRTDTTIKKSYVYKLFLINQAKNCFFNKNYEESRRRLNSINEETQEISHLLSAQIKILLFQLDIVKSQNSSMIPSFSSLTKSLEYLVYDVKHKTWKTFSEKCVVQLLLIEVTLLVVNTFLDLRMIRQARCYSRSLLTVALRLALPLRVCEFLTVLSNADITTGNSRDAADKLSGLDAILGLDQVNLSESEKNSEYCFLSETTSVADVKRPQFLSHDLKCSCIICSNMSLMSIILSAFGLKVMYTSSAGAIELARHIGEIGRDIVSFLRKKEDFTSETLLNFYYNSVVRFFVSLSHAHAIWNDHSSTIACLAQASVLLENKLDNSFLKKKIWEITFYTKMDTVRLTTPVKYQPKVYADEGLPKDAARTPEPQQTGGGLLARKLKRAFLTPSTANLPITPYIGKNARRNIFDEEDTSPGGKYETNDKENVGSPEHLTPTKSPSGRSPLARVLPSRNTRLQKNLIFDETPGPETPWKSKTPQPAQFLGSRKIETVKTYTRKAQTEKKKTLENWLNPISTPLSQRAIPKITIFCDDDDNEPSSSKNTRTVKKKKQEAIGHKSTVKTEKKKQAIGSVNRRTRRKVLNVSDLSEDEEDRKVVKTESCRPETSRRLFLDSAEEGKPPSESAPQDRNSASHEVSGIIEASFDEEAEKRFPVLPLTPLGGLEQEMRKLTLSGKKMVSLSTKKMSKLKNPVDTPKGSGLPVRSTRLNKRNPRK